MKTTGLRPLSSVFQPGSSWMEGMSGLGGWRVRMGATGRVWTQKSYLCCHTHLDTSLSWTWAEGQDNRRECRESVGSVGKKATFPKYIKVLIIWELWILPTLPTLPTLHTLSFFFLSFFFSVKPKLEYKNGTISLLSHFWMSGRHVGNVNTDIESLAQHTRLLVFFVLQDHSLTCRTNTIHSSHTKVVRFPVLHTRLLCPFFGLLDTIRLCTSFYILPRYLNLGT